MRRICHSIAFAALALTAPSWAAEPEEAPAVSTQMTEDAAKVAEAVRPALWKVADEDTTIYVFGTIHILPEGVKWFDGEIADAFAVSEELVTEIVEEEPATMQALVLQKAILPPDQSLRGLLSPEQRLSFEQAVAGFGLPPAMFDRFELWYAAVGLSTMPLMKEGYSPESGVEKILEKKATERGLAHSALETAEYQLSLFDGLPLPVQARYLGEVIDQLPNIKADLTAMVEAWKQGDAETLASLMNAEETDPVLVDTLLINRNKAWADWIDQRLDKPGVVFLAVGAGHLAGEGSLQEQLLEDGIASERLQ